MSRQTTVTEEFEVTTGPDSVTVRKLLTPRGQLVELEAVPDAPESAVQLRVDALGLESLSWQTESDLASRLGCGPPSEWAGGSESRTTAESFEISNEYADVVVSKVTGPGGDALVVRAPVKRTELQLHPVLLRELTACDADLFSEFLETPHGPHDH